MSFINKKANKKIDQNLSITINTKNKKYLTAKIVIDKEEIKHLIVIALKTEFGEVDKLDKYGSTIRNYIHKDYLNDSILDKITSVIKDSIKHIISDCIVECKNELSDGNFYCQNLSVYIYNQDETLFLKENLSDLLGEVVLL